MKLLNFILFFTKDATYFDDFSYLYNNRQFSDVSLVVEDSDSREVFYAHKCVLAARSLYFRTMFSSKMVPC